MPTQAVSSGRHHAGPSRASNQDEHVLHIHGQTAVASPARKIAAKDDSVSQLSSSAATTISSSSSSAHFLSTQQTASVQVIDGINPYVEQQESDNDDDAYDEEYDEEYDDDDDDTDGVYEQSLDEWENPSYLVKNLDTGESYNVEEIDLHYNLVTLDVVAAQHESKDEDGNETSTSSYLLQLYTADETADIEIEDAVGGGDDEVSRMRTANLSSEAVLGSADIPSHPVKCNFQGCNELHQRASGYCSNHEMIAKEEEDSRVQALYLIPMGARAEFVKINGHGFVYDSSSRLYTVYTIEMRCVQSGASWVIYRRYQEFKMLNDCLRPMGVRVPILPPKKIFGAFEPEFIAKRQGELSEWLHSDTFQGFTFENTSLLEAVATEEASI
uniref:PX domain-containing protein n=1 Tax=Globisporangium ultimum (strain ATCC 200006 / CBS 805.95 / DAOM BR144) TaxID=431595 RepID=K3WIU6_GLOUD